jgi:signal transduction histidine kinase
MAREMAERTWAAVETRRRTGRAARKDEFLAMLAHELRNPLAPIGAAAELLQMMKLDEHRCGRRARSSAARSTT